MKISGPFFHDTSQENLYLKSELSRCRKLISEFEASYFHQKNNKLQEENANIKERLHKLSDELEAMAQKHKQTSDTERSLQEIRAGVRSIKSSFCKNCFSRKRFGGKMRWKKSTVCILQM